MLLFEDASSSYIGTVGAAGPVTPLLIAHQRLASCIGTEGGVVSQSGLAVQAQIHYPTVDFAGIPVFLDELAGESHSSNLMASAGVGVATTSASGKRCLPASGFLSV